MYACNYYTFASSYVFMTLYRELFKKLANISICKYSYISVVKQSYMNTYVQITVLITFLQAIRMVKKSNLIQHNSQR